MNERQEIGTASEQPNSFEEVTVPHHVGGHRKKKSGNGNEAERQENFEDVCDWARSCWRERFGIANNDINDMGKNEMQLKGEVMTSCANLKAVSLRGSSMRPRSANSDIVEQHNRCTCPNQRKLQASSISARLSMSTLALADACLGQCPCALFPAFIISFPTSPILYTAP